MKATLVKDQIGGFKLVTESGELLENLYVKSWERKGDTVNRVILEIVQIIKEDGKNW